MVGVSVARKEGDYFIEKLGTNFKDFGIMVAIYKDCRYRPKLRAFAKMKQSIHCQVMVLLVYVV
mgnify:CR=1 FL=1